jgi:hypothetical protein
VDAWFKLLPDHPWAALVVLPVIAVGALWLAWRSERKEYNNVQAARIDDLKGALELNTKASLEQAAANRALAEKFEFLRQEIVQRARK